MKDGAMVLFEGQVGTINIENQVFIKEIAIDFVPVDEAKVNTDRAKDYFPYTQSILLNCQSKKGKNKKDNGLRRELNARYDAFVAKMGLFPRERQQVSLSCLTASVWKSLQLEMQLGKI